MVFFLKGDNKANNLLNLNPLNPLKSSIKKNIVINYYSVI